MFKKELSLSPKWKWNEKTEFNPSLIHSSCFLKCVYKHKQNIYIFLYILPFMDLLYTFSNPDGLPDLALGFLVICSCWLRNLYWSNTSPTKNRSI
jgi:hypothetical protein